MESQVCAVGSFSRIGSTSSRNHSASVVSSADGAPSRGSVIRYDPGASEGSHCYDEREAQIVACRLSFMSAMSDSSKTGIGVAPYG